MAIRVDTIQLTATREDLPVELKGLDEYTLQNLQDELDPVPPGFENIEYWPENLVSQSIQDTEKFGDEILTLAANKIIDVTYEVLNKTADELQADADAAQEQAEQDAMTDFKAEAKAALPTKYDENDIEVLKILRTEVYHFDTEAAATPLCAIVAGKLGVSETAVRDSVRTKGNDYYVNLVTAWADRRVIIGEA